jgi:hypothetical protein
MAMKRTPHWQLRGIRGNWLQTQAAGAAVHIRLAARLGARQGLSRRRSTQVSRQPLAGPWSVCRARGVHGIPPASAERFWRPPWRLRPGVELSPDVERSRAGRLPLSPRRLHGTMARWSTPVFGRRAHHALSS